MSVRVGWWGKQKDGRGRFHLVHLLKITGTDGRMFVAGWHRFSRLELEEFREQGVRLRLRALGVVSFTADVSPALYHAVFADVRVTGSVRGRPQARGAGVTA